MNVVEAEAPGKVLWLGGYSVLEKNHGFVTTVSAKVHVRAKKRSDNKLQILSPVASKAVEGTIGADGSIKINGAQELALVIKSIEVSVKYILATEGSGISGMHIKTNNDAQIAYRTINMGDGTKKVVKSGLGSSAAVSVATVGAVLKLLSGNDPDTETVHKLAQLSHSLATEKIGSGFDIAAATYGTIVYRRYDPDIIKNFPSQFTPEDLEKIVKKRWGYKIEKLDLPRFFVPAFAKFPNESAITLSMVKNVNKFKNDNPEKYYSIINEIKKQDMIAIEALKRIKTLDYPDMDELLVFREAFDKSRLLTKNLGALSMTAIEPEDCTALIDESKTHGAFVAKLPGSGGKDSIAALALKRNDAAKLRNFWSNQEHLEIMNISITNKGFGYLKSTE